MGHRRSLQGLHLCARKQCDSGSLYQSASSWVWLEQGAHDRSVKLIVIIIQHPPFCWMLCVVWRSPFIEEFGVPVGLIFFMGSSPPTESEAVMRLEVLKGDDKARAFEMKLPAIKNERREATKRPCMIAAEFVLCCEWSDKISWTAVKSTLGRSLESC